ncbi:MAG: SOUL family heme-binding protein [Tangfeifania sp.]
MIPAFILFSATISKSSSNSESQEYETLFKKGNFEIRYYPPAVMASVEMQGTYDSMKNPGFNLLAGYIFGGNSENKKISMTTPVRMKEDKEAGRMSFVMPSEFTFEKLPTPDNEKIFLHKTEPAYVASLQFGGYANNKKIESKKKELKQKLVEMEIEHTGDFEYLGYSAPYKMLNRRNEVVLYLKNFNPDRLKTIAPRIDEA